MQIRFLLGPAGSGKTQRCLARIRAELARAPDGPPLILLAPKQATFQLERQLLGWGEQLVAAKRRAQTDPREPLAALATGNSPPPDQGEVLGYTRLRILSFERLAHFVFEQLRQPPPPLLDEEGRLMVLRALLAKRRNDLKLFRASARLAGFAQQLSRVLHELQQNQLTPESLLKLAARTQAAAGLSLKLQDLATLLRDYLDWLAAHHLQDVDCLLTAATKALVESPQSAVHSPQSLTTGAVWLDGFAEFSPQELELLAALVAHCGQATIAFCLDREPAEKISWLSTWSQLRQTFEACRNRLADLPGAEISVETLPRDPVQSRFQGNPVLAHLERHWAEAGPFTIYDLRFTRPAEPEEITPHASRLTPHLRLATCPNPEAEATLAAREILRFVRAGGRFRDVSVILRQLEGYHAVLQRAFSRYGIPFFLDRRESVSHHPLAELTRSALRLVAFSWTHDDWFAALKTGLVPADEREVDRLENEALARGWKGAAWQQPIQIPDEPELSGRLEQLRQKVVPPFQKLALHLAERRHKPTGPQLAEALREFWQALQVEEQLDEWAEAEVASSEFRIPSSVHSTVWEQMNDWLDNVELAFPGEALGLREWLPILEAGLANLTVGVIPPALDQVLIGAIDRSRNPDIQLALVLGLNEGIFPAPPEPTALLTDADRDELERHAIVLGANARRQLGRERYLAYIACTRARQRLVLTCSAFDADDQPLNPSPFLARIRQLFPALEVETPPRAGDWRDGEHPNELIAPLLRVQNLKLSSSQDGRARHSVRAVGNNPDALVDNPGAQRTDAPYLAARSSAFTRPGPPEGGTPNLLPRGAAVPAAGSSGVSPLESTPGGTPGEPAGGDARATTSVFQNWDQLARVPALKLALDRLRHFRVQTEDEALAPELAEKLFGSTLRTSVSRLEQFAACPFRFFVHSGLRAEERKLFELDAREQGSFQHDALALFHQQLRDDGKRWRDLTPADARERIGKIARALMISYRDGLLQASDETKFTAKVLAGALQDFVETLVGWMREQYAFDPVQVELPFGESDASPAWELDLGEGHRLALYGRIDRVDVCAAPERGEAFCVVVDYKSSQKQLDPTLVTHGLQLQLLAYLNALRHWPDPRELFGAARLVPAGVFYVNLRGKYERAPNRTSALAEAGSARMFAYRHTGRFDARVLRKLDARPDAAQGDQFNYRLTKDGSLHKGSREALTTEAFTALLNSVETNLRVMGREIFAGAIRVAPFRKGAQTACAQCDYQAVCRIDPWTHPFRVLKKPAAEEAE